MKKIALILAFLILCSMVAVKAPENPTCGEIVKITDAEANTYEQVTMNMHPEIYANKIIWSVVNGSRGSLGRTAYLYDISTGQTTEIPSSGGYYKIYKEKIVWDSPGIWMLDLSTNQRKQITNISSASHPKMYDDKLVWMDFRTGWDNGRDAYMYDLSSGQETRITTGADLFSSPGLGPQIYGDKIVWQDNRKGHMEADIYMYDISKGETIPITTHSGHQAGPAIYEDKIVWQDNRRNGNFDIYMYDLSTGQETPITTSRSLNVWPDIHGDKIVWSSSYSKGLYVYDLSTHQETAINLSIVANYPKIYENTIVWYTSINEDKSDIYMTTICGTGTTCVNGSCVTGQPTCTDDCSPSGTNTCSGTTGYTTCGNYDTDSCLEWSTVTSCPSGTTCVNGMCVQQTEGNETEGNETNATCPEYVNIVCGTDGQTYTNSCYASLAGVNVAYVGECETSPPGQNETEPDLVVTDLSILPSEPKDGDTVYVTVKIMNGGDKASEQVLTTWYLDGAAIAGSVLPRLEPQALSFLKNNWTLSEGNHTIALEVDPDNSMNESDETNNRLAKDIIVSEKGPCAEKNHVLLCHKPGTNAEQGLCVAPEAVPAHMHHGDYLGGCIVSNESESAAPGQGQKKGKVTFSIVLTEVKPETPVELVLNRPDTDIQNIKVKTNKEFVNLKIHFKSQDEVPEDVTRPMQKVSRYMVIEHPEVDNTQIENATIDFKVEKVWLEENGAEIEDVVLSKFIEGEWLDLATRFINSDDTHYYFEADSDGLSVFAVTLKGTEATTEESEGVPLRGAFPQTPIASIPKWFTYAIIGAALIGLLLPRKKVRHRRRQKREEE